jgi:choline-sulfatase
MDLRHQMQSFDRVPKRYLFPFVAFRTYQLLSGWPTVSGDTVISEFLQTLDGLEAPFFAWAHLMDIHGPQHPSVVNEGEMYRAGAVRQFRSHANKVSDIYDPPSDARYDSTLRFVDNQLARVKRWLVDTDLWDETALVLTADHGDALCDRGVYEHPDHYVRDELLKIPLLVRIPGEEGRRIDSLMSLGWLHELLADIGDWGRINAPLTTDRSSHLNENEDHAKPTVLADSLSDRGHTVVVREEGHKLVTHNGELQDIDRTDPKVTPAGLYDLSVHPRERCESKAMPRLHQIAESISTTPDEFATNRSVQSDSAELDASVEDQLKQLGYRD